MSPDIAKVPYRAQLPPAETQGSNWQASQITSVPGHLQGPETAAHPQWSAGMDPPYRTERKEERWLPAYVAGWWGTGELHSARHL